MSYNLTEDAKDIVRWIVRENRAGNLPSEFVVTWMGSSGAIVHHLGGQHPELSKGTLDALDREGLVMSDKSYETKTSTSGSKRPKVKETTRERGRRCTLMGRAFEAVDSDFDAPDTSFVKHLTPLADVTNLDDELKMRCLPILGAGGADPMMWDSAVRAAGVILEERLRDVGRIEDSGRVGRDLVNDVFGKGGALAGRFALDAERLGHRDLYAGMVGAFRNRNAHRFTDPTPEDGGALIVFVNLLLGMLEDLRYD